MAQILWGNGLLDVRRIVVDEITPHWMRSTLQGLALNLGLDFAGRSVAPKSGDLWVGRLPERGWGESQRAIGWVRGSDVYSAISQLRKADPIYSIDEAPLCPARA